MIKKLIRYKKLIKAIKLYDIYKTNVMIIGCRTNESLHIISFEEFLERIQNNARLETNLWSMAYYDVEKQDDNKDKLISEYYN